MRIYLVRHGEALPEEQDPRRPLSTKGREQAEVMARFLKAKGISVGAVWHSDKLRAVQTANLLGSSVHSATGVMERKGLAPMDPVVPIADEVAQSSEDRMIIGHLPFLSKLVSLLVMGSEAWDIISFGEVTAVCLEGDPHQGWRIAWMMTPETAALQNP